MRKEDVMRAMTAWCENDDACAIHAADRDAVRTTEALRALVLELSQCGESTARDLFNACARLGGALADAGASPSLAATTLDGAAMAMARAGIAIDGAHLAAARASLVEGYVLAAIEGERKAQKRSWEYPACAVRVDSETLAVVAGYPDDDAESLANWAARVALSARRDGIRRVILGGARGHGQDAARTELAQTFGLLGIAITDRLEKSGWLRLPFCKG
ncbi:MAG: hypothetical protein FWD73_04460 [Polyangiaceae bacterium]|nr:hypothetical protein [Polyangiaceae bacterium]